VGIGGGPCFGGGGGGGSSGPKTGLSSLAPRLGIVDGLLIDALLKLASVAVLNKVSSARSCVGFTDCEEADLRFW